MAGSYRQRTYNRIMRITGLGILLLMSALLAPPLRAEMRSRAEIDQLRGADRAAP